MYVNIMILCLKPLILKLYVAILSHFQQIVPVTVLPHKYYTALPINCFVTVLPTYYYTAIPIVKKEEEFYLNMFLPKSFFFCF